MKQAFIKLSRRTNTLLKINSAPLKKQAFLFILLIPVFACQSKTDKDQLKKEVYDTEKAFEKMAAEKGISEAFAFFADENAVIKRQDDSLIIGKENIFHFYNRPSIDSASVSWTPDFVDVSESGDLAYTYGKYVWRKASAKGDTLESRGIFHTVWKRQKDGSWKYVWD